jgi:DNA polymerase III epsilon subunit-like protein
MSYLVIDTETTGLTFDHLRADAPEQPRMASCALLFVNDSLELEHEWNGLIKPDGWTMPAEVERINGLSTEKLLASGGAVFYSLAIYGAAVDTGRVVVAHNIHFDTKIIRGELRRSGLSDRYNQTRTICTMIHGRRVCGRGSLAFVHETLCGAKLQDAHSARADAHACLRVLRELSRRAGNPSMLVNLPRVAA